jgi:sugar transferase (PEP-CTERM/EpsH1 system associated)
MERTATLSIVAKPTSSNGFGKVPDGGKLNSTNKIRIAHVLNYLAPAGKELGILKLTRHMNPDIFDITLVVMNEIRESDKMNLKGFNIIELKHPGGNSFNIPLKLSRIFRKHKIEIVHTHSWGTLVEGVLGAKLAGVPVIIHGEHGTFPNNLTHRIVQHIAWRFTDRILSVSGILKSKLAKELNFPKDKIEVILNGVDDKIFHPNPTLRQKFRERFGFSDDTFVVGTVGRLTKVKNQLMLMKAAEQMYLQGHDLEVVIVGGYTVGDGVESELRTFAEQSAIRKHIHFIGFQEDTELYYNGFDVFALTSLSEGCSNVIQEAMSCGVPVVATNVGGNPELVIDGETGFLVPSDAPNTLTDKLIQLKHDHQLRAYFARNARQHAVSRFSLDVMVQSYESLYLRMWAIKVVAAEIIHS